VGPQKPHLGESAHLRWLGHATVVVELDGARVITDPVLRRRVMHLRRAGDVVPPGSIDAILISHLHYDHLDLPSLARIGIDTPIVIPRGGKKTVRGFELVTEVEPGEELDVAGLTIRVVEARHEGRRRNLGAPVPAVGYVLAGSRSVYFAGDTGLFDGMRRLSPIDVALLPIWGWGANVGAGHLDPRAAAAALALLRPHLAVPIHWGTYHVLGRRDHGRAPADAFAVAALEAAPEVDVRVLPIGGALEF
jgi:L-ascorbate metabolism protein UlaG (beta-lactamase superfamily)